MNKPVEQTHYEVYVDSVYDSDVIKHWTYDAAEKCAKDWADEIAKKHEPCKVVITKVTEQIVLQIVIK